MNVNIAFFVEIPVNTEFFRPCTHHGQRGLDRFLHNFTERTGISQLAFARYARGFDGQQVAADFGPRQPGYLTYTVFVIRAAIVKALNAQVIVQIVPVNLDVFQCRIHQ